MKQRPRPADRVQLGPDRGRIASSWAPGSRPGCIAPVDLLHQLGARIAGNLCASIHQLGRSRWIAGRGSRAVNSTSWAGSLDRSRRIAGHCVAQLRALGVPRPYVWGNAGAARWAYFTQFSPGKRKPAGHCWRAGNISALGGPIWSAGQRLGQERK